MTGYAARNHHVIERVYAAYLERRPARYAVAPLGQCTYRLVKMRLFNGSERIVLPSGVGKRTFEEQPDREIYRKVIKEFLSASSED